MLEIDLLQGNDWGRDGSSRGSVAARVRGRIEHSHDRGPLYEQGRLGDLPIKAADNHFARRRRRAYLRATVGGLRFRSGRRPGQGRRLALRGGPGFAGRRGRRGRELHLRLRQIGGDQRLRLRSRLGNGFRDVDDQRRSLRDVGRQEGQGVGTVQRRVVRRQVRQHHGARVQQQAQDERPPGPPGRCRSPEHLSMRRPCLRMTGGGHVWTDLERAVTHCQHEARSPEQGDAAPLLNAVS